MNAWVLRGLVLAAVQVVIRTLLGFAIAQWPLQGSFLRWGMFLLVVIAALAWGFVDGRSDREAHPDPDDGDDLTMLWLKAGLLGAVVAGAVAWVVGKLPHFDLGDQGIFFELTSGAAWTTLLIFVPAMIGIAIGWYVVGRRRRKAESASGPARDTVSLEK
jgi:hypothetical protein